MAVIANRCQKVPFSRGGPRGNPGRALFVGTAPAYGVTIEELARDCIAGRDYLRRKLRSLECSVQAALLAGKSSTLRIRADLLTAVTFQALPPPVFNLSLFVVT